MTRSVHALEKAPEQPKAGGSQVRTPSPVPEVSEEPAGPADAWNEIAMILAGMLRREEDWPAADRRVAVPAPIAAKDEDRAAAERREAAEARAPPDPEAPLRLEAQDRRDDDATRLLEGKVPPPRSPPLPRPGGGGPGAEKEVPDLNAAPPRELSPSRGREAAPASPEAPPGGASPRTIVGRWQGGVGAAAGGMPRPKVEAPAAAKAEVAKAKGAVEKRNEEAREGMTEDALKAAPKAPPVEDPPPPPPSNPVPTHTKAILDLSGKRLLPETMPGMVMSPDREVEGEKIPAEMPKLGDRPVRPDIFQVLTTPGAETLAGDPSAKVGEDGKPTKEAKAFISALEQLDPVKRAEKAAKAEAPPQKGEPVVLKDEGPEPMEPVPKDMEAPVGQVVARLLAQSDQTVKGALDTLRTYAYPKGVLKKEFPDIGSDMAEELKGPVETELRDIALAANVSAEQLQGMVAERQALLSGSAATAKADAKVTGDEAVATARDEGQKTMDSVASAARAAEEETLRQQEAAGGASDPTIINRRRDLTVSWIREQVTTQITNYQNAGDKRVGELGEFQRGQTDAYSALSQRHQYVVLNPDPTGGQRPVRAAREPLDPNRERLLADIVAAVRAWTDDRVKEVGEYFRKRIKATNETTRANRKAIEDAGSAGIEAARRWAEDKVLEGKSWWDRFIARIKRWLSEADSLNEQWKVRRTRENRDAVVRDLQLVQAAQKLLDEGVAKEQILATEGLSNAQKAVLEQYFSKQGTTPLEFAAHRLQTTIALDHLEGVKAKFEATLISMPVAAGQYAEVEKINQVAMSTGGGFDGAKIAQDCHAAMDQIGTDEGKIFGALKGLTPLRGAVVRKFYRAIFDSDLDDDLESEMSGDELGRAQAQIAGQEAKADAIALHDAVAGLGTDEKAIMDLLRSKTPEEIEAIKAEYLSKYGETLDEALKDDLEEGNEIDQANALMRGDTATADAIALDEAMRGGLTGWGTGEEEIEAVYERVRSEVKGRAQAENWTSAQMEAEIRRRLKAIDARFEDRYKNVEQYNEPGATGSTLQRAFRSELSGPELDLALALQDNDLTRADAARIEIERQSSFYASDEKLVGVLRAQYERALEARRLDEGPARNMRVRRLVDELRQKRPALSEEEISRQRMALERQMESELDAGAQRDSKVSMEALTDVYQKNYRPSLAYVLAFNMSGTDAQAAQALLKQGKLTDLQEVEFATRGDGTDEDQLRKTLSRMTRAEIKELREDWEKLHPGQSFDAMLRGELSGRDESDIMDMVAHGAPESALEQIEQERRRVERERNELTGVLGGAAAGNEEAWMQHQYDKLAELRGGLTRTDWPDTEEGRRQREELMEKVDFRITRVQDAVADHRRRIDSFTDAATQVVGVVVGVAVAVILGAISGGTLGVATIALIASLYATTATMLTKALIKGGAYGDEEMGIDLAVGAVDALTAVATAGMGSKLLGPMKTFLGKTRVGDVASWIGKSGMVQKAMQAPVLGRTAGMAGRFLPSRAAMERGAAKFLAEGMEDAVGAVPSTVTQLALTDTTWKGDPLINFLEGGGMSILQSIAMGRMLGAGMDAGGALFTAGRGRLRMGTEVGRLMEAQRILADSYSAFREDNPHASPADFLAHPDGRKARAEIEERGLLPTIESVNRQIQADAELRAQAAEADPAAPKRPASDAEARVQQLESGIPQTVREGTFVTPDPTLTGKAVHVEPLRIGDRIVGVEIRVGPDATPLDIALHGATVHAMQKYRGVLGEVRRKLETMAAVLTGSGLHVGSAGWEARLEMAKLPAIIASKMDSLAGKALTPDLQAAVLADISALDRQYRRHATVFFTAALRGAAGRGYVAAEDAPRFDPKALAELRAAVEKVASSREPKEADVAAAKALAEQLGRQWDLSAADVLGLVAPPPRELAPRLPRELEPGFDPARDLSRADAESLAREREAAARRRDAEFAARKQELETAQKQYLVDMSLRQLQAELMALAEGGGDMQAALALANELAIQLDVSHAALVRGLGSAPREFADAFAPDRAKDAARHDHIAQAKAVRERMLRALEVEVRQQRLLTEFAARLEASQGDIATRVFDDMITWIIQTERRKATERAKAELDKILPPTPKERRPNVPKPDRPKVNESEGVRELEFQFGRPGTKERPQGRFPSSKELVHALRGTEIAGLDLRGFVLKSVLDANVAAIRELQARVRDPDVVVLGVKRGGALMLQLLAGATGDLPSNFITVEKGRLTADEAKLSEEERTWIQRTREMEPIIRAQIAAGKTHFVIADFYMGGLATAQFRDMCFNILKQHPDVTFETVWLREQYGFERNTLNADFPPALFETPERRADFPDAGLAHGGIERQKVIPRAWGDSIKQSVVPVRFVLGDDMDFALIDDLDAAVRPETQLPIRIFDSDGQIIKEIKVGDRDPRTGEVLVTSRQIIIALMLGHFEGQY